MIIICKRCERMIDTDAEEMVETKDGLVCECCASDEEKESE